MHFQKHNFGACSLLLLLLACEAQFCACLLLLLAFETQFCVGSIEDSTSDIVAIKSGEEPLCNTIIYQNLVCAAQRN